MKILTLLEQNARLSVQQLAMMTGMTEQQVADEIDGYVQKGIILGYRAVIDWNKVGKDRIQAFIRIKVTPQPGSGFEDVARRIMTMPEVESVYLISGGYDMSLTMTAHNLRDVAAFVSERLSTLGSVTATDTTFVLERYKEGGVNFTPEKPSDEGSDIIL